MDVKYLAYLRISKAERTSLFEKERRKELTCMGEGLCIGYSA